jgi:2-polyprenyl-3-methyl-5-hydroxy-6-metoxy-1,4-benzoquinol methylase
VSPDARYDDYASTYNAWIVTTDGDPYAQTLLDVVGDVSGQRILDIGCGAGRLSRPIAALGNEVVGIDLSAGMLAHAGTTDGVTYHHASATTTDWWDRVPFDGIVSCMALMDIDDLAGAVHTAATTVRPGGWFAWSINHPAFPGIEEVRSSWPTGGSYFDEGLWFTDGAGVRGHVGANHRTIGTYLNTCIDAGFVLERFVEPRWQLSPDHPAMPWFLITRWRRVARS